MATHQYTRESSGATVGAGVDHTYTTSVFSVPAGERFVRMKVYMGPSGAQTLRMRGSAQTIFGGNGWDQWATTTTGVWSSGSGATVKVHNTGSSGLSKRLYAVFETEDLPTYGITCKTSGSGTLTANRSTAYQGQTVTLTPKPATGYALSGYTSSPIVTITNNKFTMPNSAVTVTATFTNQKYTVNVVSESTSKGTVTGGGTVAYGSKIPIVATPKAGYKFTGWTATRGSVTNPSAESTTFTVPAGNATVTAHFERSQSTVKRHNGVGYDECFVSVFDAGAWIDCDVYIYDDGEFRLCSQTQ